MSDQWRPEFLRSRAAYTGRLGQGRRAADDRPIHPPKAAVVVDPVRARHIARARKLKALADRPGTPAEGDAARAMLRRFLKSRGLAMRDLG